LALVEIELLMLYPHFSQNDESRDIKSAKI